MSHDQPDVQPVDPPADPPADSSRDADLPIDPDSGSRSTWDILLAIAVGGACGSLGRWGLAEAFPHAADEVAWGTVLANVAGAFLLGVLMVLVVGRWPDQRLVRPFLGIGVLGGFTTFSTYALDTRDLLTAGRPALAAAYLLGTLVLGLLAVVAGLRLARSLTASGSRSTAA